MDARLEDVFAVDVSLVAYAQYVALVHDVVDAVLLPVQRTFRTHRQIHTVTFYINLQHTHLYDLTWFHHFMRISHKFIGQAQKYALNHLDVRPHLQMHQSWSHWSPHLQAACLQSIAPTSVISSRNLAVRNSRTRVTTWFFQFR